MSVASRTSTAHNHPANHEPVYEVRSRQSEEKRMSRFSRMESMPSAIIRATVAAASILALAAASPAVRCATTPLASGAMAVQLRTDDLVQPLGIDDLTPHFSWQMRDARPGAAQTAYRIQVATSESALGGGQADIWDSGRVASAQSVGVVYAGPALRPMTRYWWRVTLWDKDGKSMSASVPDWWETGLLAPAAVAQQHDVQWIGWQTDEERALRAADARWITAPDDATPVAANASQQVLAYRLSFSAQHPVKRAILFVAGEDTVSAWVNGHAVAHAAPMPPWHQFPWRKYRRIDVTAAVKAGENLLAIQTLHYVAPRAKASTEPPVPMSATLLLTAADGTMQSYVTGVGTQWQVRSQATASDDSTDGDAWTRATTLPDANDWKPAVDFAGTAAARQMDEPLSKPWPAESVKALRRSFAIHQPIVSARLYATALGVYSMWVNGHPVSDAMLAPGWTDDRERIVYQTYDLTRQLTQGNNVLAAEIAPGWYSTPLQWFQQPNVYGLTLPSLAALLHLRFADGSDQWIATDSAWKAAQSPILKAEIYDGETRDARLEMPGWKTAAFVEDARWHAAALRNPALDDVRFVAQDFQPVRVERLLRARSVAQPKPGVYVYDFGQNFAGVERLALSGARGATVRVRTGEIVNADGSLYTDNLRTARSTDTFVLGGSGTEIVQPRFTFHGFRYLEITGLAQPLPLDSVTGVVFHTDAPFTAQLTTGSPMLNQLWSNILWGQRSNFISVPTDCPQRDERLGWAADAQVFWRTASYNMQLAAFSRKYARDLRGTQVGSAAGTDVTGDIYGIFAPGVTRTSAQSGAGWSDAGVIIPWTSWLQTGDTTILTQNWAAMTRYMSAIERTNPDHLWKNNAGIHFGDWLSPEGPTRFLLVATAYWAYDATLMRQMAHALGRTADEQHYAQLFDQIRAAYQAAFVGVDGFVAGASKRGSGMAVNNPNIVAHSADTQTGYVLTLAMRLAPESLRSRVADHLVARIHANHDRLGTGFLGTPSLLAVLTDTGHADLAYHLLLNTEYPSWGYLVDHGATTTWERWNGDQMKSDPSMNSYNHYAYGAVADWIYRYAAGVDATPVDAGFHTVLLHPTFSRQLGSLDFRYASAYGQIHSAWTISGGKAHWTITLPANTTGELRLTPAEATQYHQNGQSLRAAATEQGSGIHAQPTDGTSTVFTLAAGSYSFVVDSVP